MDLIKVTLNITLPGRVLYSKRESKKLVNHEKTTKSGIVKQVQRFVFDADKMETFTVIVADNNGRNKERLTVNMRGCKPATQCININEESYNYMVSSNCPAFMKPKEWGQLSKKKRLEAHLNDIAEGLGGIVASYNVYDD
jgi:hypothetical protein